MIFVKKGSGSGSGANVNEVLAQELYKPVIKKYKQRKVYPRFKDNISVGDLADMGSLYCNNWGVECLLCIIDIFTNMLRLNLWLVKNLKQFLMVLFQ